MKKLAIALMACAALTFTFSACKGGAAKGNKIGVSMPTKSLPRWVKDGENMKKQLEAAGYTVDLQIAGDNDIPTQVNQLENMIEQGCKVLVIAAIDGSALTKVLDTAKKAGIGVVSYDRLIMNTDAVNYYATFDNYKVGVLQAQYLIEKLDLDNAPGPFNIEMFTGDAADNNINFFFGGAKDTLQPYFDNGKLKVLSGQTEQAQCATPNWSVEEAQKRMENLIVNQKYGKGGVKLDAVLCSNDTTALGVTTALTGSGFTSADIPVITGQDGDVPNVKNIIVGTQGMSVFKDTRILASQAVKMVDAIMKGEIPETNDNQSYNNGTGIIPTFLCQLFVVTADNYKEVLIDTGYYTADELKTDDIK